MAKRKVRRQKIYAVDWFTESGRNYRTTLGCTWAQVQDCKKRAANMGETIKYEFDHYEEYEYQ